MITQTESHNYTVADFIDDLKAMLEAFGPTEAALEQAARLMRHLTARDDLYPGVSHADLSDDHPGVRLHAEPDGSLALMLAKFPAEEPTRVHNHNSWGVACIYKGVDLYVKWERRDDGGRVGYAEVVEVERKTLRRGDAVWWLDPPHDIHSQWGQEGAAAWELVLMGRNIAGQDRLYFEPQTGRVWAGPAVHLRSAEDGFRG